jgi:hypothetical protein
MSDIIMEQQVNELAISLRDMAKFLDGQNAIILRTAATVLLTQQKIIRDVQQILGE